MADYTGTLAAGCFGKVYKQRINGAWAAVKKVPQHVIDKKDLERECEVYNIAEHNNIVKLLGNITASDRMWIIPMEFIFGEDLETTIFNSARSKIPLTKENKATIIVGMCEGLNHLHSKDIVHQDLKPDNVMVEHGTCRAVIIDLGLAKFFKGGLNSAIDRGNDAYSAPEILRKGVERNQRSDVWAMGKIIAELCARIRLATLSVRPEKIREKISNEPYCNAVCRMVESNVMLRATMAGVIRDIRLAGGKVKVVNTSMQKDYLQTPSPNMTAKNRSPSPIIGRSPSPLNMASPQINRSPSPVNMASPQINRSPSPVNMASPQINRSTSPVNMASPQINRSTSPFNKASPQINRSPSPLNMASPQINRSPSPVNMASPPYTSRWERTPTPDINSQSSEAGLFPSSSLQKFEDLSRNQALVPVGSRDLSNEFMKMQLYKEAGKDLCFNLPTTGRVTRQSFDINRVGGEWEQQETVIQRGQIVKYEKVTYNMK